MNSIKDGLFYFDEYTSKKMVGVYHESAKEIPILGQYDILVVGGSQTGVIAAIAGARKGMNVCLVERFGFLGGQSLYSLVVQWEKRAFINNLGAVLTKGIPKEILDRIVSKGGSDGMWNEPPGCPEMRGGEEWLDPEAIKLTLMEMCEEEKIDLLFHTLAVDVMMKIGENDSQLRQVSGVIFENKTGRFAIQAKRIIDASADLDLIWRALGEEGCGLRSPDQRMTSGFYAWYAGIDNETFIKWYVNNPNASGIYPNPKKYPKKVLKHLKEKKEIKVGAAVFAEILDEAEEDGLLEPIETILENAQMSGMISLETKWVGNDRWCLNIISIMNLNMLDTWQLTEYEIIRQKLVYYLLPILRRIPGWTNCYISRESSYMGSRESRWLKAMKIIDQKHIWDEKHETEPTPDDTVGRSGAHDPGKNLVKAGYPIPYGILIPEKLDGIIVCARSVGTAPDRALDAHRGITPSMVTGQAAGTAAAMSILSNVQPRILEPIKLQDQLRSDGVQLDHESVEFNFVIPNEKIRKIPKK
jgi:FAD-dependent oxidoreductase family protein